MSRKNRQKSQQEPEFANNLTLLEMAYGGETVARLNSQPESALETFSASNKTAEDFHPKPVQDGKEDSVPSHTGIEELNQTGNSIVPDNQVVFVAGGLPGERVDVQLYRRKKSYLRGNVVRIIEASPQRQEAPCPYFGIEKWPNCGGCQWQHAAYNAQIAFKASILKDQLVRLGGFENPVLLDPVPAQSTWGYRNNVEFQIDRNTGRPCYHRQNSIRLVPVESCHIAHPLLTLAIEPLAHALAAHLPGKVHQVTVRVGPVSGEGAVGAEEITALAPYYTDETARMAALERFSALEPLQIALNSKRARLMFTLRMLGPADLGPFVEEMQTALDRYAELTIIAEGKKRRLDIQCGPAYLEEVLDEISYRIPPLAFFQSNSPMAGKLVEQVLEAFAKAGCNLKGASLLDLFCGVGTFSLQLARRGANVLGIEEYEGAVEAAEENARLNGLQSLARFVTAKAEDYILQLEEKGEHFNGVLLDPPRRGCDPALLQSLLKTCPAAVVYVSCDPSTLARDLKILCGGGYNLVYSRVVDLFPQTYHMESISLLQKV